MKSSAKLIQSENDSILLLTIKIALISEKYEEISDTEQQDIELISKDLPNNSKQNLHTSANPKTGDDITIWIGMMFASVIGIIAIFYFKT